MRDAGRGSAETDPRREEGALTSSLSGRLAVAGDGWLRAQTRSGYLDVTLEVHDVAPALEPAAPGDELMETPDVGVRPFQDE